MAVARENYARQLLQLQNEAQTRLQAISPELQSSDPATFRDGLGKFRAEIAVYLGQLQKLHPPPAIARFEPAELSIGRRLLLSTQILIRAIDSHNRAAARVAYAQFSRTAQSAEAREQALAHQLAHRLGSRIR